MAQRLPGTAPDEAVITLVITLVCQ